MSALVAHYKPQLRELPILAPPEWLEELLAADCKQLFLLLAAYSFERMVASLESKPALVWAPVFPPWESQYSVRNISISPIHFAEKELPARQQQLPAMWVEPEPENIAASRRPVEMRLATLESVVLTEQLEQALALAKISH